MNQNKKHQQGSILIMSVMALLALTAGVFLLNSTQTAQTRISQTDIKLMEEYEMKRTLINRTALDYRKYILYQGGTYNSLITSCVKSTNTFDPWKNDSYNGVNYSVSVCDNTDADTNYTNDTDYFLWFKIAATFPDSRARTYYALMEPGNPNGCSLSVIVSLDSYASKNRWTLMQGTTTVASRTFTSAHNLTTQTNAVLLSIGVPYVFTIYDMFHTGFSYGASYYFRLRNNTAGVNIFNKTGIPSDAWSSCTATINMDSTCANPATLVCERYGTPLPTSSPTPTPTGTSTPTPTPTSGPGCTPCYSNSDCLAFLDPGLPGCYQTGSTPPTITPTCNYIGATRSDRCTITCYNPDWGSTWTYSGNCN